MTQLVTSSAASRVNRLWSLVGFMLAVWLGMPAHAQVCAAPGATGAATIATANTVVNTYHPGTTAGGAAGSAAVGYASGSSRGAVAPIAAGDLVLIIQMQDGTGATLANDATYAFPATTAGNYEFARVLSVGTNVLNLTANLVNTYTQNTAVANNQTYQVIRVPQYAALTINAAASVVPAPWDGTSGGIVVADIAGAFVNNGSINASYAGFRGNAGLTFTGVAGAAAQTVANFDRVRPDAYTAHGGKGEGTAGTPDRVMNVFSTPGVLITSGTTSANGTSTNAGTSTTSIAATAQSMPRLLLAAATTAARVQQAHRVTPVAGEQIHRRSTIPRTAAAAAGAAPGPAALAATLGTTTPQSAAAAVMP